MPRQGFRHFRVDRIERLALANETFVSEPGRTLDDFFQHISEEERERLSSRINFVAEGKDEGE